MFKQSCKRKKRCLRYQELSDELRFDDELGILKILLACVKKDSITIHALSNPGARNSIVWCCSLTTHGNRSFEIGHRMITEFDSELMV